MRNKTIYISQDDAQYLQELLNVERTPNHFEQNNLQELETELKRGTLIDPDDIPQDVITMNSTVHLLDLDTEEEMIFKFGFS